MHSATSADTPARLLTFDEVTTVEPVGPGRARAAISADWTVAGRPHGGYLAALLARAMSRPPGLPDVVAVSAHYLRSPDPGPVEIRTELLRAGRSVGHARAALVQDGRTCTEALLTLGRLDDTDSAPAWEGGSSAPPRSLFADGVRVRPDPTAFPVALFDHVDARLDPDQSDILRGRPRCSSPPTSAHGPNPGPYASSSAPS